MIKVLHVFGRMERGGAETRTVELMPLLFKKGVQFDFCTMREGKGPLDDKIHSLNGNIFVCPLRPNVWSFGHRFKKFLKESDYDIVHSHGHYFSGYIVHLADKAGIESRIVHFRNTFDGNVRTLGRQLYDRIMRGWIDKHATGVLAVCKAAMDMSWGNNWRDDPRMHVTYNGLDLSPFNQSGDERESVLKELGLVRESKLVTTVGRLCPQKAHNILLESATNVITNDPTVHFLIAGIGTLRSDLEAQAESLNIADNIHFLGLRSDVPRLLKSSDCFVLSSRWEGLPGVVLEALAAHLPIVATDLPGVREIAEHTDLISTVPVDAPKILSEKIIETLTNYRQKTCKENSFPEVFDLEACAERLYQIYLSQIK